MYVYSPLCTVADVEDRMVPLLKKYDEELLTASSSGGYVCIFAGIDVYVYTVADILSQ